jgi:hypothetical protein
MPVDGIAGKLWRTVTFPFRAAAPFLLLAGRAARGEYWAEQTYERTGSGPDLRLSDETDTQGPSDGAGPLNHRTYRVWITNSKLSPEQLVEAFRANPNRLGPTSFATFVPDPAPDGLVESAEFEVKLPGPWDGPVYVHEVRPERVRLNTRVGHMEAGWIEFRASSSEGVTQFAIESFARSGDPVFDALYHQVGVAKLVQTQMWTAVLESAVEVSGGTQQGRLDVETIIYEGAQQ